MAKKFVYLFSETDETMRDLVGGKGANLGQMTKLGFPVPQGFSISTDACLDYFAKDSKIASGIEKEIFAAIEKLENENRKPIKTFNYVWITDGDEIRKIFGNKKKEKE